MLYITHLCTIDETERKQYEVESLVAVSVKFNDFMNIKRHNKLSV